MQKTMQFANAEIVLNQETKKFSHNNPKPGSIIMNDSPTLPPGQPQAGVRQLLMQRIYLKDASLELPNAPKIFLRSETPALEVQMSTAVQMVEADTHEVTLTVTATAKIGEDVAFLVEVHQAGIFVLRGFAPQELQAVLATFAPNSLFPFVRETISSLVSRSGFPPVLLQPVNFDAMYAELLARQQQQQPANGGSVVVQ